MIDPLKVTFEIPDIDNNEIKCIAVMVSALDEYLTEPDEIKRTIEYVQDYAKCKSRRMLSISDEDKVKS